MSYQEGSATWSLGVLVGLPLLLLGFFALLAIGFLAKRWADTHKGDYDQGVVRWISRAVFAVSAIWIVLMAVGYYPWKAEYHQYVTKMGQVENISSRLLGSSDSFQQKFVAEFTDGRKFGCEDTRCALVRPGDTLVMACKRSWQYAGVDGYDCKFIASTRA